MTRSVVGVLPGATPGRTLLVVTLGILQTIGTLTIDIYLPAFPAIAAEFAASQAAIQFTFTGAMIGSIAGQLVTGPWSDRVGRRMPLVIACFVHVLASLACAIAPSAEMLAGARVVLGFAAAATGVIALSMVRDLYRGQAMITMLARMALISGVAIAVGPLIGSQLLQIMSWRDVFVVLAGYGLLVGLMVVLLLGETLPRGLRHPPWRGLLRARIVHVLSDRVFVGLVLVSSFMWAGMFNYLSSSSFLFQSVFGLTATQYGLVFASHAVLMLAGNQLSAVMVRRFGYGSMLILSTLGTVAASVAMIVFEPVTASMGLIAMLVPLWAFTFFLGAGTPMLNALTLSRHSGADAGTAASSLGAVKQGLGAIVSPVAGLIGITSVLPVAAVMLLTQILAVVVLWFVVQPRRSNLIVQD